VKRNPNDLRPNVDASSPAIANQSDGPKSWICPDCGYVRVVGAVHSCLQAPGIVTHQRPIEPLVIHHIGNRPHSHGTSRGAA
jgi:hypothetical protein